MVVIKSECAKPGISPAKQLAEHDDMSINLTIDVYLGFITHKMSGRFRPIKADQAVIRKALTELQESGDLDQAYKEITTNTGSWSTHYFLNKSRIQMEAFKEHVSSFYFCGFVHILCNRYFKIFESSCDYI